MQNKRAIITTPFPTLDQVAALAELTCAANKAAQKHIPSLSA
jgi:hypothetical protein